MALAANFPTAELISSFFLEDHIMVAAILALSFHFGIIFLVTFVFQYLERKWAADMQMRVSHNRFGFFGIGHTMAAFIRDLGRDMPIEDGRYSIFFQLSPVLSLTFLISAMSIIPWSQNLNVANPQWGLLYIFWVLCMVQYFVFFSANSSSNLLASVLSYRSIQITVTVLVPIGLSLFSPAFFVGSGSLEDIVKNQGGFPWQWMIFRFPPSILAFVALYGALLVWSDYGPFSLADRLEGFQGGLFSQYSGIGKTTKDILNTLKLLMSLCLLTVLFLGGWQIPLELDSWGRAVNFLQFAAFFAKVFLLYIFSVWIRWSMPLVSPGQVNKFAWYMLAPTAFLSAILSLIWGYSILGN